MSASLPPSAERPLRRLPLWAVLAYAIGAFLLVDKVLSVSAAWVYPRWNDQIQYLTEAYMAEEAGRANGWVAGLRQSWENPAAQGAVHDSLAYLVFSVAGPSRSAALAVPVLFWVGFHTALLLWVRRRWLGGDVAVMAAGLAWLWWGPWMYGPGSLADFRLDLPAAAGWGLALLAALSSQGFRSWRGALLFGAAVGLCVSLRFLTGVYFALAYAVFVIWILGGRAPGPRLARLGASAALATGIVLPVVWVNRQVIWDYYVVGHFTGRESGIRDLQFSVGQSLREILIWLVEWHTGKPLLLIVLALATWAAVQVWRRREAEPASPEGRAEWTWPTATFFFAPLTVLVLHKQKSPVVEGVLVPSLIVLGVQAWGLLRARGLFPRWGWTVAALVLGLGLGQAAASVQRILSDQGFYEQTRKVNAVTDRVWKVAQERGWSQPRVGVNRVTDCFDAQVLRVIWYERHRRWVPAIMTLPTGIMAETDELLWSRLRESDFVFLAAEEPQPVGYPYDQQMHRLGPAMRAWCEAELERLESFDYAGRHWVLYVKKAG